MVISGGQIYIIELAARLSGGFFCSHITPAAYGVDFLDAAIMVALGEIPGWQVGQGGLRSLGMRMDPQTFVSQRYIFPDKADIGKKVVSVADPGTSPFATYNVRPGDIVQPVDCHPRRWGQVICTGNTPTAAREAAQTFVGLLKHGVHFE